MTIALRVFALSMAFGLVVSAAYWFDTREAAGTILIGVMGLAFVWVISYLLGTRKSTHYDGDEQRLPSELAGEHIGIFAAESPWPIVLALASAALLIGIVLHPMLGVFAILAVFIIMWQLVREST
ncbi:MAG TPA: cytochrome c oxidase subunit 4 [Candidatus Baltobacteraceae bacterium]